METDPAKDQPTDKPTIGRHDFLRLIVAGAAAGIVAPTLSATSSGAAAMVPPIMGEPGGPPPIVATGSSVSVGSSGVSSGSTTPTGSSIPGSSTFINSIAVITASSTAGLSANAVSLGENGDNAPDPETGRTGALARSSTFRFRSIPSIRAWW